MIELISIGDELLKGKILNTNSQFLCLQLRQRGYQVIRETTVSDEAASLKKCLEEALARADLVICTGGLGPTLDDHTRKIAAELFQSDFHFDPKIAEDLRSRFGEHPTWLKDQATVPTKARAWSNTAGTAPGLLFSEKGKTLILLPGVPQEMETFFFTQVVPFLEKEYPLKHKRAHRLFHFCLLYESYVDPHLRALSEQYPAVEVGIYPHPAFISVLLSSVDPTQLLQFEQALIKRFESYLFPSEHGKVEEAVHSWFIENKKTLALAESCTGGMLAAQLTGVAGASSYFLGSFVVYSDEMKQEILGVSKKTLSTFGAVSEEVIQEMLNGVFKKSEADFAIAVSGIAGPTGGTKEKPIGTICAGIAQRGKEADIGTFHVRGNRALIISKTSNSLLGAFYRKIDRGAPAFPFIDE